MSTNDRINDRLPRFYRNWDKGSILAILLKAVSDQLNIAEAGMTNLMHAHWIDTAKGSDLEKLGALVESGRIPENDDI
jgi:hypothetical protein